MQADMGSIPGLEGFHMPQGNYDPVPQLLSLCSRAQEPKWLNLQATATESACLRACAPQEEKPLQWEACTPQLEIRP